jgi:hypothetical protein
VLRAIGGLELPTFAVDLRARLRRPRLGLQGPFGLLLGLLGARLRGRQLCDLRLEPLDLERASPFSIRALDLREAGLGGFTRGRGRLELGLSLPDHRRRIGACPLELVQRSLRSREAITLPLHGAQDRSCLVALARCVAPRRALRRLHLAPREGIPTRLVPLERTITRSHRLAQRAANRLRSRHRRIQRPSLVLEFLEGQLMRSKGGALAAPALSGRGVRFADLELRLVEHLLEEWVLRQRRQRLVQTLPPRIGGVAREAPAQDVRDTGLRRQEHLRQKAFGNAAGTAATARLTQPPPEQFA